MFDSSYFDSFHHFFKEKHNPFEYEFDNEEVLPNLLRHHPNPFI